VSRFGDGYYEPIIGKDGKVKDTSGLWRSNFKRALASKRGQAALRDLRDALLALPEKRLIEGALCTVGLSERIEAMPASIPTPVDSLARTVDGRTEMTNWRRLSLIEFVEEHEDQPEGVCAIGAYVWWKKVKAGMDPADAFAALPVLPDTDAGDWETVDAGTDAGLTAALAWDLAYTNDERLAGLTPEARYDWFLNWIDKQIAVPA
jgi:hypothetical protein